FLTSARVNLLFIAAPALVTSPVMRRTVTDLLALSAVWQQRAEFTDNAGQALTDRVTDLIESWSRRKEERLEKRNRLLVNTLLAVLAGMGISGVPAMVQDGFAVAGWGVGLAGRAGAGGRGRGGRRQLPQRGRASRAAAVGTWGRGRRVRVTAGLRQVVDDAELRRIYDGLLVPSFPASELVGLSWLLDGVARGRAHVVSA